jgi:hypothetical protein
MKIAVFWVVAPCSLVEVYQLITHRPDDGGSKDLWNVGKLLPDYMVLQPEDSNLQPHHTLECDELAWSLEADHTESTILSRYE